MALKRDEAKLVRSIKGEAQKGNTTAARQLAKSLVRMRQQQARLQGSKAQLGGVSNNIRVHLPPLLPTTPTRTHMHTLCSGLGLLRTFIRWYNRPQHQL